MTSIGPETRILLVGGHTRNIGKTALVVDILRAFPDAQWTAVKITQYGHGVCSVNGESCGCAPDQHTFSLDVEHNRDNRTDTSRFLVAGAARALWLRTKQGRLAEALPLLRDALHGAGNVVPPASCRHSVPPVIIESNSLLSLFRPDLYLVVLDPAQPDFKPSAMRFLDQADALVLRRSLSDRPWPAVSPRLLACKPAFSQTLGEPLPPALLDFLNSRFFQPHAAR